MKNKFSTNFLFYDYETFGINPISDKPVQFACIKTDFNFNLISKPIVLYCYPPIDYLPDPEAILVHSITPQYSKKYGLNESFFSKKIYDILNFPNTCILGYNNINFDDEITRNIFYRNFFNSYNWHWKNNNTRWDVLNLIRAFYALRPTGINWPKNKKNYVSFKLSDLTKINKIHHYKTHDALSDVYATINLLKLIKKNNKKFFNFLFFIRKKNNLLKLVKKNYLKPLIYISSYFGSKKNNFGRIIPLIIHPQNKNILITMDLDKKYCFKNFIKNFSKFLNFDIKYLFSIGIRFIYLNKCPILLPIVSLRNKDILRLKLDQENFFKNLCFFKKFFNIDVINKLSKINFKKKKYKHIDFKLYKNFFSFTDQEKIKNFRKLIDKNIFKENYLVSDKRFKDLWFFFKARNFPIFLNEKDKNRWKKYLINFFNKEKIFIYIEKINFLKKLYFSNSNKIYLLNKVLMYLKYLKNQLKNILTNNLF
ncbi:Exodeoxyribonuclease I [Buchnera aphidicola (Periphyllus testudinaceus)]|uniref:exodeoxyribonuclease I n=1 Tax=Buchnera aphidicola TaxID=9 RepID=UPI00346398BD